MPEKARAMDSPSSSLLSFPAVHEAAHPFPESCSLEVCVYAHPHEVPVSAGILFAFGRHPVIESKVHEHGHPNDDK